jgi:hypothetical protein
MGQAFLAYISPTTQELGTSPTFWLLKSTAQPTGQAPETIRLYW